MKPFDLKAALEGASVVTRDGRTVTQFHEFALSPDRLLFLPSLAGVLDNSIVTWKYNGRYSNYEHELDLFMAPAKREGWINILREEKVQLGCVTGCLIFLSKAHADARATSSRIACVRIEWEE